MRRRLPDATPAATLPEGVTPERFEVVVNLLSLSLRQRVRIRVQVPESDPTVDSVTDVYPGPTPWSARPTTCSASSSPATPT